MSAAAGKKPVRKFPPPCWTHDEALVLIEAYRERWHAPHRAFLRAPDWDAVAEKVTTTCPDVTPPKTAAQCRHKMEKLRQRHRVEKQRVAAFSGDRFLSTWFYFEAMEAMENGSESEPGNNNPIKLENHTPEGLNPGRGIRFKPSTVQKLATLATNSPKYNLKSSPNLGSRVSNRYPSNAIKRSNHEDDDVDNCLVETPIEETLIPTRVIESNNQKNGFLVETLTREAKNHKDSSIRMNNCSIRPRKFSKVVHDDDENGGVRVKTPRNTNWGQYQNVCNLIPIGKELKKKRKQNGGIMEMVASIRLLGDGFLKMEKMKIDVVREIEKMRMDYEMKRNELMIESHKQIVDVFVNGVMESRKQPTTMAQL